MEPTTADQYLNFNIDSQVTFGGNILNLKLGSMHINSSLPRSNNLVAVNLDKFSISSGRKKIIFTVPSLDTPVCEYQIVELSKKMKSQDDNNFDYFVISIDTPFAQARFIKKHDISQTITFLSDYASHQFMITSGLMLDELSLFTRAIIVCDELNIVKNVIIPKEITQLPKY